MDKSLKKLIFFIIFLFLSCQGKAIEPLASVKTYEIASPFVSLFKDISPSFAFTFGFFLKDTDGNLVQSTSGVESIQLKTPGGSIKSIPPQTPYQNASAYALRLSSGYVNYGKNLVLGSRSVDSAALWLYVDYNTSDVEEGNYEFTVRIKGKEIKAVVPFQKFYLVQLPADPLYYDFPVNFAYDKSSRMLSWEKSYYAEGYRVQIFDALEEDWSQLIYSSDDMKITNIWNINPYDNNRVQITVPQSVSISSGKIYIFKIDSYFFVLRA